MLNRLLQIFKKKRNRHSFIAGPIELSSITFNEFSQWCNNRSADGCWSMLTAMACIDIVTTVNNMPKASREGQWSSKYEKQVLEEIVNPINAKRLEYIEQWEIT